MQVQREHACRERETRYTTQAVQQRQRGNFFTRSWGWFTRVVKQAVQSVIDKPRRLLRVVAIGVGFATGGFGIVCAIAAGAWEFFSTLQSGLTEKLNEKWQEGKKMVIKQVSRVATFAKNKRIAMAKAWKQFIDAFQNMNLGQALKALGELGKHFGSSPQGILILVGLITSFRDNIVGGCIIVAGVVDLTLFGGWSDRFIQQDGGQSMGPTSSPSESPLTSLTSPPSSSPTSEPISPTSRPSTSPETSPIIQTNHDPRLEELRRQHAINQMRNRSRR